MAIQERDYLHRDWRYRLHQGSVVLALGLIIALIIFFLALSMLAQQHAALTIKMAQEHLEVSFYDPSLSH